MDDRLDTLEDAMAQQIEHEATDWTVCPQWPLVRGHDLHQGPGAIRGWVGRLGRYPQEIPIIGQCRA